MRFGLSEVDDSRQTSDRFCPQSEHFAALRNDFGSRSLTDYFQGFCSTSTPGRRRHLGFKVAEPLVTIINRRGEMEIRHHLFELKLLGHAG